MSTDDTDPLNPENPEELEDKERRSFMQGMVLGGLVLSHSTAGSDGGIFGGLFGGSDNDGPGWLEDMVIKHEGDTIIADPEIIEFVGPAVESVELANHYDDAVRIKLVGGNGFWSETADGAVTPADGQPVHTDKLYNGFATETKHTSAKRKAFSWDNQDVYVDPTGDDSNDGTSSNPLATIQEALDRMPTILRHQYRIHLADGTYTENPQMDAGHFIGSQYDADGGAFFIEGNSTTPSNVVIDGNPHLVNTIQGETDKALIKDLEIGGTLVGKAGSYGLENVTFSNASAATLSDNGRSVAISIHAPGTLVLENCEFTADAYDVGALLARNATLELFNCSGKLSHYVAEVERGAQLKESNVGSVWGERNFVNILTAGSWIDYNSLRRHPRVAFADDFDDGGAIDDRRTLPVGFPYPDYTVESGSPTLEDGYINFPAGDTTNQDISSPFRFPRATTGTWMLDFRWATKPTAGQMNIRFIQQDSNNEIILKLHADENSNNTGVLDMYKVNSGTTTKLLDTTYGTDTNRHVLEITRSEDIDGSGNAGWEVFMDGSQKGSTVTDSFVPEPRKYRFFNQADQAFECRHWRMEKGT